MGSQANWPHVLNLGNSIIGVTVLAMPFCFQQCGVILGSLVLFFCTWLTLVSCKLLITAGISSRKRSYGFLAQYTHGAPGKLAVEIGMIGLQIGTLIAQVVIIGDLGPAIISKWTGLPNTNNLRTALIVLACTCIGLPLGLLRNLNTVSRASTFCICFYSVFVVYVMGLALPNLKAGNWFQNVNLWRVDGLFKCLPIFSFAFGCQTQLFILYDALPEPSLKEISSIVSSAVNMCMVAYLLVGFFGYVAFCDTTIGGDVITQFSETLVVDIIQILFVLSIVVTFPLIIYPCRGSFYTLLFAQKPKHEDIESRPIIPEIHFKVITIFIVLFSMVVGILVPNVEFVLAMNGATMGTLICYIFPAVFFLRVMTASSEKKNVAQFVFIVGVTIMVLCTYTTLNSQDHVQPKPLVVEKLPVTQKPESKPVEKIIKDEKNALREDKKRIMDQKEKDKRVEQPDKESKIKPPSEDDKRQEPPNPHPPDNGPVADNAPVEGNNSQKEIVKEKKTTKQTTSNISSKNVNKKLKQKSKAKDGEGQKKSPPDERVKREEADTEGAGEGEKKAEVKDTVKDTQAEKEAEQKQQDLLDELKKQQVEHKKLIQEQREILEELKEHKRAAHKDDGTKIQAMAPANNGENVENPNKGQQQQQVVNQQQGVNQQQFQQNQQPPQGQQQNIGQGQIDQQVVNQQQFQQNQQQAQGQQQQNIQGQGQINQAQIRQPQQGSFQGQGQSQQGNIQVQGNQPIQQENLQGQNQLNQGQQFNQNAFNQQVNQNLPMDGNQNQLGQNQVNQQQQQNIQQGQGQINQQQAFQNSAQEQVQQQPQQVVNQKPDNNINNINIPAQQNMLQQAPAAVNNGGLKNPQNADTQNLGAAPQESKVVNSGPVKQTAEKVEKSDPNKGKKAKPPHSDI